MADAFYYKPDGVTITPYPFDGTLTETTAAGLLAVIGGISGIEIQQGGVAVTGSPFTTINYTSGATLAQSSGDANVVDVTITAAGGDISLQNNAPTGDVTITAGYSAYVPGGFEVANTKTLEVGLGSTFELG